MDPAQTQSLGDEEPLKDAVLLVDDERPLLGMYEAALSSFFEVVTASTSAEAREWLGKKAFKVVLADHVMPRESGLDLLTTLKDEFPHIQRILATGYMKPDMLTRSVSEAAVFCTLTKPVPIAVLVHTLQEAVRAHDESKTGDRIPDSGAAVAG